MQPEEAGECESILRSLPDWFGIEESIVQYRRDIESMETVVADRAQEILGFLTWRRHGPRSAEIQVLGVRAPWHRRGVGRSLVAEVERRLRGDSVELFQVKTLGPSRPDEAYARTRMFYESLGFVPLEENRLWGERIPCLISVKHLTCTGRPLGAV